jgi:hypothetical protein
MELAAMQTFLAVSPLQKNVLLLFVCQNCSNHLRQNMVSVLQSFVHLVYLAYNRDFILRTPRTQHLLPCHHHYSSCPI